MNGTPDIAGEQARAILRSLREARGWSLAEMARQVPYSKSYLSKLETGAKRITPDIARCLDETLETDGALVAVLPNPDTPVPASGELEPTGTEVCPYPGLAAFGPDQSRWFFGRDQVIARLITQLDDRLAGNGLLAVVAPSGAGKSSLLAAGLITALARGALPGSRTWPVVTTTPGAHPLAALAERVAERAGVDPAEAVAAAGDPERFAAFLTRAVATYTGEQGQESSTAQIVLIVDQFEETFTECRRETDRQTFIAALSAAAHSAAALVVLGVRADFYGSCLAYPELLTALQSPVALGPMSADQLRAVITCPAQAEGLILEPGLVELLLRDLGVAEDAGAASYDPGVLPLLAHALRATWHHRHGHMLTVAGYRCTSGISQALATTAERAYTQLSPTEQQITRQVLLRLVNISDLGASDTRRRSSRAQLIKALPLPESAPALDTVLDVFARARLLTLDTASVEITHEALLRAWPRLRHWIDADRAGNLIRQELDQAAAVWDRDRHDTAGLYRGNRLEAARTWAASHAHEGDLSPTASVFLAASVRQERRATALRRVAFVVLCMLVLLASGAAALALHQSAAAQRERDNAIFDQITAQADRLRSTDISLAAQLDLTAYSMRQTPDLYTALLTDANAALSTPLAGHSNYVRAVAFSPDGRILATGSADQSVRLWNVTDPAHPTSLGPPLTGHTNYVDAVAFSPDGHILATGGADHTVRLWNVADPAHPTPLGSPLTGHTNSVRSVVFSPDGHALASGSDDQTVRLWNVTDPAHPTSLGLPLTGHTSFVFAVAFSSDGRTLASGSADQTVRLWNVTDPAHPTSLGLPLTGHTSFVFAVAFSSDGRTLASGSADQTVRLWNVTDPAHPTSLGPPLTGHTSFVHAVAFSSDGHILATGSDDQTVRLWNVTNPTQPTPLGQRLTGHVNSVNAVAFSPDGHTLATGSADHTIRLWNIPSALMTGHTSFVHAVAFSPDGRTLASGSADHIVRLWNVADPAHPTPLGPPLTGHTDKVLAVAFSSDGRTLASGSADHTVRLWNVADPAHPTPLGPPLTGHTSFVFAVAFSPDGRTLASGSADHTVRLWNVADPAHPTLLSPPLTGHTSSIFAVVFSPDGRTLATGSADHTVRLWNMSDPAHPTSLGPPLTGHADTVRAVVFSPDGHTLASGSDDHTVRLWNMSDPAHPTPLGQSLIGHTNWVAAVAFSPDGHTLATGSADHTVRLWNMSDPAHPTPLGQSLIGHTNWVAAVAFSPDGHTLATGSWDQTAQLWGMNVDQAIQRICATTTNTLTTANWEQYVLRDLPYRSPCP